MRIPAYSTVGNRLSSLGVSPYAYNASNQLTSKPGVTYTYDANGNTLTQTDASGTTTYAWDFENRLTSVRLPNAAVISFKYHPFGRRIQKTSATGTTVFAYDGDNIIEELSATGLVTAQYTQALGIDEPLAMYRSGATNFYHADGLGSIAALTDTTGSPAAAYVYDSFGNTITVPGSVTNPFRYTAREFDIETGLYYYRARYYDSVTGRFLSEDPAKLDAGISYYEYVENSPANYFDFAGRRKIKERPVNLPLGTPVRFWPPFTDGFKEALRRLRNRKCRDFFCGKGPETLRSTEFRFLELPEGPGIGARAVDSSHVQINSSGVFITGKDGKIQLAGGAFIDLGSITNVRAFIILHELGHELRDVTGFREDRDDAALNQKHSLKIVEVCF